MADNKKSFIAYCDWLETFEALPDDKAGQLAKHLFRYVNDLNPETDDILIKAVFANIKHTLKRDLIKYETIKLKRSESGKMGGRPKKQTKAKKANGFLGKQTKAKKADSVNDNVSVSVNDIKKKYIPEIINYLNKKTKKDFKPSTKVTKEKINARLNEGFTIEDFQKVIDNKAKDWLTDPKMNEYLRPETLFGTKFESYLNKSEPKKGKKVNMDEILKNLNYE